MDAEALRMLKAIFQKKSDNRPDTTQCLQMKFISNHILLTTLPTETLEPSKGDETFSDILFIDFHTENENYFFLRILFI